MDKNCTHHWGLKGVRCPSCVAAKLALLQTALSKAEDELADERKSWGKEEEAHISNLQASEAKVTALEKELKESREDSLSKDVALARIRNIISVGGVVRPPYVEQMNEALGFSKKLLEKDRKRVESNTLKWAIGKVEIAQMALRGTGVNAVVNLLLSEFKRGVEK